MSSVEKLKSLYEQLLELPENVVGEIVAEDLHVSPRPAPKHAVAASVLGGELTGPFSRGRGGPGGWWILDEPEIHLDSNVLVPDLAGWKKERLPQIPDEAFFSMAPDWVCEVLSPSTAVLDRVRKMPIYARYKVAHIWLIDPLIKTVEIYKLENESWSLKGSFSADERIKAQPFEAIEIELSALWS